MVTFLDIHGITHQANVVRWHYTPTTTRAILACEGRRKSISTPRLNLEHSVDCMACIAEGTR
jgi:hypothetical protein